MERYLTKKEKIRFFREKCLPLWSILPLISIFVLNCLIYWGSGILTANRYHFDFTTSLDRAVPLIPQFIWIYVLAFPFWAMNYILASQRGKDGFYRFVATDLTVHFACFVFFLILPTTNIRPEIVGNTWSEQLLKFVYMIDGASTPSNLFPSIHCYVSWLSWRGVRKSEKIPKWYQHFSLIFAILIIISTQVLKQHYLVDAIAGVGLVELAWRFYSNGNHHDIFRKFFEKISGTLFSK